MSVKKENPFNPILTTEQAASLAAGASVRVHDRYIIAVTRHGSDRVLFLQPLAFDFSTLEKDAKEFDDLDSAKHLAKILHEATGEHTEVRTKKGQ